MKLVFTIILAVIVVQCVTFVFALYHTYGFKKAAVFIPAALMSVIGLHMLLNIFEMNYNFTWLPDFAEGFGLFYGPLFLVYTKALIYKEFEWKSYEFIHFLPGLVFSGVTAWIDHSSIFYAHAFFVSMSVYLYIAIKKISAYQKVIMDTQSEYDGIALGWLKNASKISMALLFVNIIAIWLTIAGFNIAATIGNICIFLLIFLLVNTFIIKGFKQPVLFEGISIDEREISQEADNKYKRTQLSANEIKQYKSVLIDIMANKKLFLDPELNINTLANELKCNPRHISQVINLEFKQSFSDYINQQRVNFAKELLNQNNKLKIVDVQLDAGFNTKSNFNRAFKKFTHLSPSHYRAQLGPH